MGAGPMRPVHMESLMQITDLLAQMGGLGSMARELGDCGKRIVPKDYVDPVSGTATRKATPSPRVISSMIFSRCRLLCLAAA